jgi:hypothetical protein
LYDGNARAEGRTTTAAAAAAAAAATTTTTITTTTTDALLLTLLLTVLQSCQNFDRWNLFLVSLLILNLFGLSASPPRRSVLY